MTYEEKLEFLNEHIRMPGSSIEGEDLMRLLSLVSHLTVLYSEKEKVKAKSEGRLPKKVSPLIILANACGKATMQTEIELYEKVSLHCDLLISREAKFDTYGAKTVKEMMTEIKRTTELWLPF